jgi:DNA-binding transcriptional LysR family regulator
MALWHESAVRLASVDLNLLVALDILLAERNVTRAGQRLHLSQPAMSGTLARLRRLFDDPLIVRRSNVASLTPFADSLVEPVRDILAKVEETLRFRPTFDPELDARNFTIICSDYLVTVLMAPLLRRLEQVAPNFRLTVEPIDPTFAELIVNDQVDLLIMPKEVADDTWNLPCQPLFTERFACAVWREHPEVGETISVEQLERLPYLAFRAGATGRSYADIQLAERGIALKTEITTSSYLAVPFLLAGTRLVATTPVRFARRIADVAQIRLLDPPVDLLPIVHTMYWHPRRAFDPGHSWLRGIVADVVSTI